MQWNFYKNFIPLTHKIEAGADLVRTITSINMKTGNDVAVGLIFISLC